MPDKPSQTTPQEMIAWLGNVIERRDKNLHTNTSAKMERAIKAYIEKTLKQRNPLCGITKENIND